MQVQEELARRSRGHIATSGKKEASAQTMYIHKLFSAESVVKYTAESIGITEGKNQSYGDVSAGLKIQDYHAIPELCRRI